jgi:4-hydroxy-tetrahydrodipicolinate synthase
MSLHDLRGVVPPIVTPLAQDGRVDHDALERLIDATVAAGASGVFVLGSSGEGPWFPVGEQGQIVRTAVAAAARRIPVLAGVLEPSTDRVLDAMHRAADDGADAVVVTTPYYFAAAGATLVRHFERVLAHASVPVVLYNIPQMTHNRLLAATIGEVLDAESLVGVKDSSGEPQALLDLIGLKERKPGFRVFQGAEKFALEGVRAGADGVVPGLGNVATRAFVRLIDAVHAGRDGEAQVIQDRIDALWTLHEHGPWLACLKHAVALAGFGDGATLAGDNLDDEARAAVRIAYQAYEAAEGRPDPTTSTA